MGLRGGLIKIKLNLNDKETRRIWETALQARLEVMSWSAWKRGNMTHQYKPGDAVIYTVQGGFRDGLRPQIEVHTEITAVNQDSTGIDVFIYIGELGGWISATDPHLRPVMQ